MKVMRMFILFSAAVICLTIPSSMAATEATPTSGIPSIAARQTIQMEIADLKARLSEERDRRVTLETNVNNLQDTLYMMQADIMKMFELLNEQVDRVVKGHKVAFYARLATHYEDIQPWATIVFSNIETNYGGAYSGVSGEFTAPISGNFVFYSHILSKADKSIETSLQINGQNKMYLYSGGKFQGSGSNMAVLHLNAGDVVKMVKHGPWGTKPFYIHTTWSSFSGFLLEADGHSTVPTDKPPN